MTWLKTLNPFVQGLLGALTAMVLAWLSLQAYRTYQVVEFVRPIMLQQRAAEAAQKAQQQKTTQPPPIPSGEASQGSNAEAKP